MVSTEELSDTHLNVKKLSSSINGMQKELMQAEQHIANESPESADKIVKTLKRHSRTFRKKAKKRLEHIDKDFSSLLSMLKERKQSIHCEGKSLTELETETREKLQSLASDKKLLNKNLMDLDEIMKVILHMEKTLVPDKTVTFVGEEINTGLTVNEENLNEVASNVVGPQIVNESNKVSSNEPKEKVAESAKKSPAIFLKENVNVKHEETSKKPEGVEDEAASPVKKHLPAMVHDDVGDSNAANLHEEISKEHADADRVGDEAANHLPTMIKDDAVQQAVANDTQLSSPPLAELEPNEDTVVEVSTREEASRGSTKRRSRFKRVKSKIGSVLHWRRGSSKDETSVEGSFVSTVTVEDSAVSSEFLCSQADDETVLDPGQDSPSQRRRSSRWLRFSSILSRPKTSGDSKATSQENEAA